jgi:PRA1 family protein
LLTPIAFLCSHCNLLSKEKWDASGANDVIARAGASLPQGTTEYLTVTSQQLFNREKLRSVTVCFGIGEERPFYFEKAPSLLLIRVQHNLGFFFMNYMILTATLFCLTLLITPSAIMGIALLGALWVYVIRSTQNGPMLVYGK